MRLQLITEYRHGFNLDDTHLNLNGIKSDDFDDLSPEELAQLGLSDSDVSPLPKQPYINHDHKSEQHNSLRLNNDELLNDLRYIEANMIIDIDLFRYHIPFIYIPGLPIAYGDDNEYHSSIDVTNTRFKDVYRGTSNEESAVGRIGRHLIKKASNSNSAGEYTRARWPWKALNMPEVSVVAFYPRETTTPDVISSCVQQLLTDKQVDRATYVVYANQVLTVAALTQSDSNLDAANSEQIRLGKLQVALHLGAWPDGRRLTNTERDLIMKELGISKTGPSAKYKMQVASARAGVTIPGQKWWAPHSESRDR